MKEILIKPLITEKMSADAERTIAMVLLLLLEQTRSRLKRRSKRIQRNEVCSYTRVDGKAKQRYTKTGMVKGRTNGYKKALVSLAKGEV